MYMDCTSMDFLVQRLFPMSTWMYMLVPWNGMTLGFGNGMGLRLTSASMKSVAKSLVFESYTEKFIIKSSGLRSDQHECLQTSRQAINLWVTVHNYCGEANEVSLCTWNQCLGRVYQFSERKKAFRKSMPCLLIPAFLENTPAQKKLGAHCTFLSAMQR